MATTVSPTSQSENAYSPTWYETPRSLIHGVRCENCKPERPKSKRASCSIQMPTSSSETSTASEPVAYRESGSTQTTTAAPIGSQMRSEVNSETVIAR